MKKRILWTLVLALAMVLLPMGCTYKPYHPTKSEREWTIDHKACEEWVREGIRDEPDTYDDFDEMRLIRRCMTNKGWQWERIDWFTIQKEPKK